MPDETTDGYSREEVTEAAELIAASLRRFVYAADQHLSGRQIEHLIQAAQSLENLNER